MQRRTAALAGAAALALLALASYFSPHWHLYRMKAAIDDQDAGRFSEHVDFPALRDSVKAQLLATMDKHLSSDELRSNPFARLGQAMAAALMNPLVDAAVSPAGVIRMMKKGDTTPGKAGSESPQNAGSSQQEPAPAYAIAYRSWNDVAVSKVGQDSGSFIFKRAGLWSWKLAAIELPKERPRESSSPR
jgi:hypothetical protein